MNNPNLQYLSYRSDCQGCDKKPCDDLYKNRCIPNLTNKVCTNSGFNYGVSSRLHYDSDFIQDDIEQSTAPLMSVIDPNRVKNCSQCLSYFGPRQGHNGWGDSIALADPGVAPAQQLVDIDSIMSNRNVKQDRSKKGMVNMVDVFKFKTYDSSICDRALDPLSSISTFPKQLYREMSINRFYDLNLNPQVNIYYDWAVNSRLEAKDNYDYPYPFSVTHDNAIPVAIPGKTQQELKLPAIDPHTNVYNRRPHSTSGYYTDSDEEDSHDMNINSMDINKVNMMNMQNQSNQSNQPNGFVRYMNKNMPNNTEGAMVANMLRNNVQPEY